MTYAKAIRGFATPKNFNDCKAVVDRLNERYPRDGYGVTVASLERFADTLPSYKGKKNTVEKEEVETLFLQWASAELAYREPGKRGELLRYSQDVAERWAVKFDRSNGWGGRLFELDIARETGIYRARWGDEGETDSALVKMEGFTSTVTVEVKTNAGDAMNIIAKNPDVVIYRLAGASHQWGYDLEPRITTGKHFIAALTAVNGLNYSTGKAMIQANMKGVWEVVNALPKWKGVDYTYTIKELEGGQQ